MDRQDFEFARDLLAAVLWTAIAVAGFYFALR
jgi:hypothetical protein